MLGLDSTSSSDNRDINNLVIINTPDIQSLVRFLNNRDIITSNTTIYTQLTKDLILQNL